MLKAHAESEKLSVRCQTFIRGDIVFDFAEMIETSENYDCAATRRESFSFTSSSILSITSSSDM